MSVNEIYNPTFRSYRVEYRSDFGRIYWQTKVEKCVSPSHALEKANDLAGTQGQDVNFIPQVYIEVL